MNFCNAYYNFVLNDALEEEFLTKHTAEGLRVTLQSTIDLVIRQVSGPNDHPSNPTFLQLYQMFSMYSIIKPPKMGNCIITISDLKSIIYDPNSTNERLEKIKNLEKKLTILLKRILSPRTTHPLKKVWRLPHLIHGFGATAGQLSIPVPGHITKS
ncbi:Uncharacterized protein FWK35_00026515 [Aphis craccivora]|uniref:Uncharacterized protein n=1 Tax=Aphis craccivora TaxID=307492 RepID=A0A6G0YKE9_APHCR|nr:Uncharacterized protein FWK35_00026515 [Aphis craccivora]